MAHAAHQARRNRAALGAAARRPDQGWEKIVSYSGAMVETASSERLIFLSVYDLTELEERQAEAEERCGRPTKN